MHSFIHSFNGEPYRRLQAPPVTPPTDVEQLLRINKLNLNVTSSLIYFISISFKLRSSRWAECKPYQGKSRKGWAPLGSTCLSSGWRGRPLWRLLTAEPGLWLMVDIVLTILERSKMSLTQLKGEKKSAFHLTVCLTKDRGAIYSRQVYLQGVRSVPLASCALCQMPESLQKTQRFLWHTLAIILCHKICPISQYLNTIPPPKSGELATRRLFWAPQTKFLPLENQKGDVLETLLNCSWRYLLLVPLNQHFTM